MKNKIGYHIKFIRYFLSWKRICCITSSFDGGGLHQINNNKLHRFYIKYLLKIIYWKNEVFYSKNLLVVVFIAVFFASCSTTKNIPENDALYTGFTINISQTEVSSKHKKVSSRNLKQLLKPKPNAKIIGMPFKLWMYNLGSEKGLGGWIRRKFGEEPVLFSRVNVKNTEELLDNYLENRGFFHVMVASETTVANKKAKVRYEIKTGPEYKIRNMFFPIDSTALGEAIRETKSETLLHPGAPFNIDLILGERIRINTILKEQGYYYFHDDYLLIEADSTIGNNSADLYMKIKKETPEEAKLAYKINDVFIYSNYHLSEAREDTAMMYAVKHQGYYVIDSAKLFKPVVFESSMQFKAGDYYSRKDHNATLSRLINLGNFKFVKNRFSIVSEGGEKKLNTYYYLTPIPGKTIRAELTGTSKTNNLIGSQIALGWKHHNTFGGAEQLSINIFAGTELQINGNFAKTTTYRIGGDISISVPGFVVPMMKIRTKGEFVPRTNLLLGYEQLNRQNLYTIRSIRANVGYLWKESVKSEHQLFPISVNYVNPISITQLYLDSIVNSPSLARITEQQFILGSTYNYNYNQLSNSTRQTGLYFNGLIDIAGNIYGTLNGANWKTNDTKSLFGVRFAQFIKTELDIRYYHQLSAQSQWATRLIAGLGYPYGNNKELPFVKQFFAGGNNSLRGFRSRTIGPGSYRSSNAGNNNALFLADQSGDIKLEMNIEYRRKLFSIFEVAMFADAGNVWLVNEDTKRPGAQFTSRFLHELAIDAGFGFRFNFTILMLRFDFAFPLKVPYAATPPDKSMVINLAIGYPF
ncbi:MAG: BamA/TamA family outer membrane protein [Saprospiraceae bacterium]|nr:BamA/TamA family outer membrane protein [Saprospiraceae bacterium]